MHFRLCVNTAAAAIVQPGTSPLTYSLIYPQQPARGRASWIVNDVSLGRAANSVVVHCGRSDNVGHISFPDILPPDLTPNPNRGNSMSVVVVLEAGQVSGGANVRTSRMVDRPIPSDARCPVSQSGRSLPRHGSICSIRPDAPVCQTNTGA